MRENILASNPVCPLSVSVALVLRRRASGQIKTRIRAAWGMRYVLLDTHARCSSKAALDLVRITALHRLLQLGGFELRQNVLDNLHPCAAWRVGEVRGRVGER